MEAWHGSLRTQMDVVVLSGPPQAAGTLVASRPQHRHSLEAGTAKDSGGVGAMEGSSQPANVGPES